MPTIILPDWQPMDRFPDYAQPILLRSEGDVVQAACHGYDVGGYPEWHDWDGERIYPHPDAWAWPPGQENPL